MKKLYVAYGSNMNRMQMAYRCPKAKAIGNAILNGYTLEFRGRNGNGVATIIKNRNTSIPVVLWSITEDCERALDVYEGFPTLYYKRDVEVEFEGKRVKAMAYVMARRYESKTMSAYPSKYYFNVIKDGYEDFGIDTTTIHEALERTKPRPKISEGLRNDITKVSKDGRTNMFDIPMVIDIATELGCEELVDFLFDEDNHNAYSNFILYGEQD